LNWGFLLSAAYSCFCSERSHTHNSSKPKETYS